MPLARSIRVSSLDLPPPEVTLGCRERATERRAFVALISEVIAALACIPKISQSS